MSGSAGNGGVAARLDALVASGAIELDGAQRDVALRLDDLLSRLSGRPSSGRATGAFAWLRGGKSREPATRGLYIWGEVGRGKTMLMDLFFAALPVRSKKRVHFHAYMADVHRRIHDWRGKLKAGEVKGDDPIKPVAEALAAEASVLCFDEFVVTDIADAMILGRLFTAMFARGVTVVATSNRVPDDLYKDGLNRALFLPFVTLLKERTEVVRLDARTDFRMEKIGSEAVFLSPAGPEADARMDALFRRLTGGAATSAETLRVLGHDVPVPRAAMGVARFTFSDLCAKPLGASDYLAIAQGFHTVFVDAIPRLDFDRRNEARRFITLIDVLYERHVRLVASAAAPPAGLYKADHGAEQFEFDRTVSRLTEMGSREYLAASRAETATGNTTGLVET